MDKYINQSITARREAFGANFEIDAEAQGKIDITKKASYAAHLGKLFGKKKN